jgi:hypothetical protein
MSDRFTMPLITGSPSRDRADGTTYVPNDLELDLPVELARLHGNRVDPSGVFFRLHTSRTRHCCNLFFV